MGWVLQEIGCCLKSLLKYAKRIGSLGGRPTQQRSVYLPGRFPGVRPYGARGAAAGGPDSRADAVRRSGATPGKVHAHPRPGDRVLGRHLESQERRVPAPSTFSRESRQHNRRPRDSRSCADPKRAESHDITFRMLHVTKTPLCFFPSTLTFLEHWAQKIAPKEMDYDAWVPVDDSLRLELVGAADKFVRTSAWFTLRAVFKTVLYTDASTTI